MANTVDVRVVSPGLDRIQLALTCQAARAVSFF
jgi:hypothetical protein